MENLDNKPAQHGVPVKRHFNPIPENLARLMIWDFVRAKVRIRVDQSKVMKPIIEAAIREAESRGVERAMLGRIDPKLAALALEAAVQRARAEAFEEAAKIADGSSDPCAKAIAKMIRHVAAKRKEG